MGLPIWRDPDENVATREAVKNDPTAAARSSIRRRPSVHGRRLRNIRPPLPRESSQRPTDQSPPAPANTASREWRHSEQRRIPSVATLLESTDNRLADARSVSEASNETVPQDRASVPRDQNTMTHLQGIVRTLQEEAEVTTRRLSDVTTRTLSAAQDMYSDDSQFHRSIDELRNRMTELEHRRAAQWRDSPFPELSSSRHAASSEIRHALPNPGAPRSPRSRTNEFNPGLPTTDASDNTESLTVPGPGDLMRQWHPLRHSWRAESPINGLGDRIRSPTPADGWETMRSTIAPDENLPSAESSFASAIASDSFSARRPTSNDTEDLSTSNSSRRTSDEGENPSDSASSIDPDDLCNDEERQATAAFATDMYLFECNSDEGQQRVDRHRTEVAAEGSRYALFDESESVEIGFRLINEALDSPAGRARVFQLSRDRPGPTQEHRNFEEWIFAHRRNSNQRRRLAHITDDEPPSPHPERYGRGTRDAAYQARGQVHDYFRRIGADALTGADEANAGSALNSPPPRYERLAARSLADANVADHSAVQSEFSNSVDRFERRREVDDWTSNDEPDLDGVRRIVERLAQREDIPDEWWTSVGLARHLNQSRSRVRSRSPERATLSVADGSTTAGRIARRSRSPRA